MWWGRGQRGIEDYVLEKKLKKRGGEVRKGGLGGGARGPTQELLDSEEVKGMFVVAGGGFYSPSHHYHHLLHHHPYHHIASRSVERKGKRERERGVWACMSLST